MAITSMSRPVRILLIVAASVVGLFLILFLIFTWFVRRPFPKVRGRTEIEGISRPVEILRDDDGVPHIWAENSDDLYFAQGWVHAQDRAWQMEFQRRVGRGRLAEILGKDLVDTDRFLRTMGLVPLVEIEYAEMAEPYKGYLDAYSAGVSAYFASRPSAKLGLEFAILGLTGVKWDVEPWHPTDSLLWGKMLTWTLSGNAKHDLRRIDLLRFVGATKREEWYARYREDMPVIATTEEIAAFRRALGIPDRTPPYEPLSGPATARRAGNRGIGTNLWALAAEKTETSGPVVVNDSHVAPYMPSIWHEIGLHVVPSAGSPESPHHVRGYAYIGGPGVVIGQNENVAWGLSMLYGDTQDYVIERIHPEDPDLYRVGDSWKRMEVSYEVIRVEGEKEPVVQKVRRTRNGPVMTDLDSHRRHGAYEYDDDLRVTELALYWPEFFDGQVLKSIFEYDRAEDVFDFREALSYWNGPSFNYVFADVAGNIAYQTVARHPLRPAQQGLIPTPGWDEAYDIPGNIPFDQMPASLNPDKGFIAACNNTPTDEGFPYYLGLEFSPGFRARRVADFVDAHPDPVSLVEIEEYFLDTYNIQGEELLSAFAVVDTEAAYRAWLDLEASWKAESDDDDEKELEGRELRKKEKKESKELEFLIDARKVLDGWDFRQETDSPGAAAYGFVLVSLIEETFEDHIPTHSWPMGTSYLVTALYELLREPDSDWWDDRRTPEVREDRDDILGRALVRGLFAAGEELDDRPGKWEWGDVHQIEWRNATLGESGIGPIEAIFNRGPYPVRGGNATMHKTNWGLKEPFDTTVIPSQRSIFDVAEPSNSVHLNSVGQSGHPFHRHYDDYIEPWLEGGSHPARFTRKEAEESAGGRILTLEPAG